jgi:predicted GIY-YIG superfamily endonuclease
MSEKQYYCYFLVSEGTNKNCTYKGCTNDINKRILQHNGLLSGGAKFTNKITCRPWKYLCIVTSQPPLTHTNALSLEWHFKHPYGRYKRAFIKNGTGSKGCFVNLIQVLSREKHANTTFNIYINEDYQEFLTKYDLKFPNNCTILTKSLKACSNLTDIIK